MKSIELNKGWQVSFFDANQSGVRVQADLQVVDLPFDILTRLERDYSSEGAEFNGYSETHNIILTKSLPKIEKDTKVFLDIHGVSGFCEVFLNDIPVRSIPYSSKYYVDLTSLINYDGVNTLKLSITNFAQSGKYTGLGISGAVSLLLSGSDVSIVPNGVFVRTTKIDSKAQLSIFAELKNELSRSKRVTLCAEIFNSKNKRVAKKTKKVRVLANQTKTFELLARLQRFYLWDLYDPNLYSVRVSVLDDESGGREVDAASSGFGIVSKSLSTRSLLVNNTPLKLKGAVVAHDNGILGNVSCPSAEIYKLTKIKQMGFNAVRYIGCPSEAALAALDKLGMLCVVDIFDVLKMSKFIMDGHVFFESEYETVVVNAVKVLRQHPSVLIYGVANNAEESYGRGSLEMVEKIVRLIKTTDPFAIVYGNAFERLPNAYEIDAFNLKAKDNSEKSSLSAAREKDLFKACTEKYFSLVDIAGYSYLHARYLIDKGIQGRLILGTASDRDKPFDAVDETEKNSNVLGDFVFAAADFLGSMDLLDRDVHQRIRPAVCTRGLLDKTYRKKDLANYTEIVLGKKGAFIVVKDPDAEEYNSIIPELSSGESGARFSGVASSTSNPAISSNDFKLSDASHLWNWPKSIGKPIVIRVLTSGDIVALTLDGKSVGRKLAGKFNRNYADFKTNFYPGRLEAVSFHKGIEQSRVTLESVTSPKMLKIECFTKSVFNGELCYFNVAVVDKEGRVVPYAMRNIEVSIEGEGELVALGNGDPEHFLASGNSVCSTFNGYITGVLKASTEGKALIKATSEGLTTAKATVKVKA